MKSNENHLAGLERSSINQWAPCPRHGTALHFPQTASANNHHESCVSIQSLMPLGFSARANARQSAARPRPSRGHCVDKHACKARPHSGRSRQNRLCQSCPQPNSWPSRKAIRVAHPPLPCPSLKTSLPSSEAACFTVFVGKLLMHPLRQTYAYTPRNDRE